MWNGFPVLSMPRFQKEPNPYQHTQAPKINPACFGTTFSSRKLLPGNEGHLLQNGHSFPQELQTTFMHFLLLIDPKISAWRVERVEQGQQRACPGLAQHWNRLPRDIVALHPWRGSNPSWTQPWDPALAAPALTGEH